MIPPYGCEVRLMGHREPDGSVVPAKGAWRLTRRRWTRRGASRHLALFAKVTYQQDRRVYETRITTSTTPQRNPT